MKHLSRHRLQPGLEGLEDRWCPRGLRISNSEIWVIWDVLYPEQTQTFAVQSCDFPIVL